MSLFRDFYDALKTNKCMQMSGLGAGMMGMGFGFWYAIGIMGAVLFFMSYLRHD